MLVITCVGAREAKIAGILTQGGYLAWLVITMLAMAALAVRYYMAYKNF